LACSHGVPRSREINLDGRCKVYQDQCATIAAGLLLPVDMNIPRIE
jgi:hypothetical protein